MAQLRHALAVLAAVPVHAAGMRGRVAARVFLFGAVISVLVAVLIPTPVLEGLRSDYPPLGDAINWVEQVYPPIDLIHVVLFAILGLLLALALPAVRRVTQLWWIALLAAATEIVQLWVPGRSAKLGDFAADILGGGAGLMVGWALVLLVVGMRGGARAPGGVAVGGSDAGVAKADQQP